MRLLRQLKKFRELFKVYRSGFDIENDFPWKTEGFFCKWFTRSDPEGYGNTALTTEMFVQSAKTGRYTI
ncbi:MULTISPECIES: DUF1493 family protein [Erwinia]|uniref:DUF1493 family protein n=1 Tax=Erwinia TaxID=551 RepID=UPI001E594C0A|nr:MULTISPECIES: DUF1493 family protein [Erwinia]